MTRLSRRRVLRYVIHDIGRAELRRRLTASTAGTPPVRVLIDSPESAGSPVPPLLPAPAVVDSAALAGAPGGNPAARQSKSGGPGPAQAHVGTDDEQPVQATSAIGVSA